MGWRVWMRNHVIACHGVNPAVQESDLAAAVRAMPPADRIALARELLAGTGRVVAREVGAKEQRRVKPWLDRPCDFVDFQDAAYGWNACRAAMMGED